MDWSVVSSTASLRRYSESLHLSVPAALEHDALLHVPDRCRRLVILKPNTHRRRRRDETVESRRVGGVYTNSQLVGDSFVVSSV